MKFLNFFKSKEWEILWPFYIAWFIPSLLIIFVPFYVIYFQQMGLSFFQISSLMFAFTITPFLFEVPTGVIADLYGRKLSVILGEFLFGFSILMVFLIQNYYFLLFIFFLMGISSSLSSGAWEAWVTDLLKYKKQSKLLHNFFIKERSLVSLGGIFAGIIGSLIVSYFGLRYIWLFSAIPLLFSGGLLFFAEERFVNKKEIFLKRIWKGISYSKFSINYSLKHPVLLLLIFASFFIAVNGGMAGMIVWQPFLVNLDFPVAWLGYLVSIGGIIAVGLPFLSKPLLKLIGKEKNYLAVNFMFYAFILLLVLLTKNWYLAIIIFLLGIFPFELGYPVEKKYFQKFVPSKYRASITSFRGMILSIGGSLGLLFAGFLADKIGPKMTIFYSLFFMIPVVIFYLMIKDK